MEREKKIIDASVAVKWFAKEENSDIAIGLRDKHKNDEIILIVPELLFLEVINALKYKKENLEKLREVNKELWNFQLSVKKLNNDLINKAIDISIENNFTIYDSIYVALAQMNDCELITGDEELAEIPNVKLLDELE